jgi:hypothetical protein
LPVVMTLPLPVRHGEPAGAAQVDIGQSCDSTCPVSDESGQRFTGVHS